MIINIDLFRKDYFMNLIFLFDAFRNKETIFIISLFFIMKTYNIFYIDDFLMEKYVNQ